MALASAAALLGGILPGVVANPAGAATITVTSTADDGSSGTLRWAVDQANTTPAADTIVLASGATYQLTDCDAGGSLVSVGGGALTIEGNGATIQQTCDDRVIWQDDESVLTLTDVTVKDGIREGGGNIGGYNLVLEGVTSTGGYALGGGGVFALESLSITDSVITGNRADVGGGIFSVGPFTITNSTVSNNTAHLGGGVATPSDNPSVTKDLLPESNRSTVADGPINAPLTMTDSTVENNTAQIGGGLAIFDGGTITRSAIVQNHAVADKDDPGEAIGGGVFSSSSLEVSNSTVAQNTAADAGGGIFTDSVEGHIGSLGLVFGTIAGNSAPKGANIYVGEANMDSTASVVSDPLGGGQNCSLVVAPDSGGYNYEAAESSCKFAAATDKSAAPDPGLEPLADYGGPTPSQLPGHGSALINAIPTSTAGCSGTDQRGIARPQGPGCDIGSVEVQQPSAVDGHYTTPNTQSLTVDLRPLVTDPDGVLNGGIYTISDGPNHGIADGHEGGDITYTPSSGYVGQDGFAYKVCNTGETTCVNARVIIDVTGLPNAAQAAVIKPVFTG